MARSRNIKPGFFKNDLLAEVHPLGRILFAGLWAIADRAGRLEDRAKRIKAEVLPYDEVDVDALLNELYLRGFIVRYSVDGYGLIQISNWSKHQNPSKKEAQSQLPGIPVEHQISIEQVQCFHTTNSADSLLLIPDIPLTDVLIPDSLSLITDSLTLEPKGEEPAAVADITGPFRDGYKDAAFADLAKAYQDNIRPITPMEADRLIEWSTRVDPAVIKMAIAEAVSNGARTMKYIEGILRAWDGAGATTVESVEAHQRDFVEKKNRGKGPPGKNSITMNKFDKFEGPMAKMTDAELKSLNEKMNAKRQEAVP